jgi:hypothetical protein
MQKVYEELFNEGAEAFVKAFEDMLEVIKWMRN